VRNSIYRLGQGKIIAVDTELEVPVRRRSLHGSSV
jgi:hypothetical protein